MTHFRAKRSLVLLLIVCIYGMFLLYIGGDNKGGGQMFRGRAKERITQKKNKKTGNRNVFYLSTVTRLWKYGVLIQNFI